MRTSIDIDEALLQRATRATGLATKKAVIEEGLRVLVRLHRQKALITLSRTALPSDPEIRRGGPQRDSRR
jgi:Arc/MetJ family transcription regulator